MFTNKDYIIAIYEEGSFSKASERLYISQPSLSATVKRLEEKLSVSLFDRSTNPISLTEAGKEYIRYALSIKEKERDFEKYIYDFTHTVKGSIRIGGSSLYSSFLLPAMISEFKKIHPKVEFEIVEDSTKNLIEKLNLGTLDIVIDNSIINNNVINSIIYTSETLLLAVPRKFAINKKLKNHRMTVDDIKSNKYLTNQYNVSLDEFNDYPFILLSPENDTGMRAKMLLKKYNLDPKIDYLLNQQVTAYNISRTGIGISFVSDTLIKNIESESELYYYKLNDLETTRNIYLCRKYNHYLSTACQKFIEFSTTK